jgi:hypothetical protein
VAWAWVSSSIVIYGTTPRCGPSTPPRSPPATRTTAGPASARVPPGYYGAFVLDPDDYRIAEYSSTA